MESYFEVSLRCPQCQGRLRREKIQQLVVLSCSYCKLHYPLYKGQVCLLVERAMRWQKG